jgi:tRNA A37 methylthiotransferase MiaB
MADQVDERVKSERSAILRAEAHAGVNRLLERHRGRVATVAWEAESDGLRRGLTDTNIRVYGSGADARHAGSALSRVRLGFSHRDGLRAEPVQMEIPLVAVS